MKKEIWLYISMLLITALIIFGLHCAAQAQTKVVAPQYDTLGKVIMMRLEYVGENEIKRDTIEFTSKELISVWNPQLMIFEDRYVYRTRKEIIITKIKP